VISSRKVQLEKKYWLIDCRIQKIRNKSFGKVKITRQAGVAGFESGAD